MPAPKEGESKEDFMKRCIPAVMDGGEANDLGEASKMCATMFAGKKECPTCNGKGIIKHEVRNSQGGTTNHLHDCSACNATGLI